MSAEPLIAWVDAVGAVLLWPGDRLTLGGPPRRDEAADLPLVAPLSPVHAAVVRAGEGWAVDRDGELTPPADDGTFTLGGDGAVRCRLTVPNPLSPAAVLSIQSDHRPVPGWGPVRLEAAVIAAGPVLIGPNRVCHVRVRGAHEPLLFRATPDGWAVRGAAPAGGSAALGWQPAAAGHELAGGGVSLRLEALPPRR